MKKIVLAIVAVASCAYALVDYTVPNTMHDDSIAYASDVNENWTSQRDAFNALLDSIESNFTRFSDIETHAFEIFRVDTLRSQHGIDVDTVTGNPWIDSLKTTFIEANKVDINGGAVDGVIIGATDPEDAYFDQINGAVVNVGSGIIDTITVEAGQINGVVIGQISSKDAYFDDASGDSAAFVWGVFANVDINGGNIDGTIIGAATPRDATFDDVTIDTLTATHTILSSVLISAGEFIGGIFRNGAIRSCSVDSASISNSSFSNVEVLGGTMDAVVIGGINPENGTFDTVTSGVDMSSKGVFSDVEISSGDIDGADIGYSTPCRGMFSDASIQNLTVIETETVRTVNVDTIWGSFYSADDSLHSPKISCDSLRLANEPMMRNFSVPCTLIAAGTPDTATGTLLVRVVANSVVNLTVMSTMTVTANADASIIFKTGDLPYDPWSGSIYFITYGLGSTAGNEAVVVQYNCVTNSGSFYPTVESTFGTQTWTIPINVSVPQW